MGKKDFFLDPDDAQTMGDINYMRRSVKVRRTFPKTLKNPDGFAVEKQVSSDEEFEFGNNNKVEAKPASSFQSQPSYFNNVPSTPVAQPTTNTAPVETAPTETTSVETTPTETTPQPVQPIEQRQQKDTSMDMFRNMAKNIRRR